MNSHDSTMSVPASAGGKLKLSEIIAAISAHEVALDCKAVLLYADLDEVVSMFDFDRIAVRKSADMRLLLLHLGLHELAKHAMKDEPEATDALEAAWARREKRERVIEKWRWSFLDIEEVDEDGAKDGKEGK